MTAKGMQNHQALDLSRNKTQGSIPQDTRIHSTRYTLESLASLEILDLSHNSLSGMIPKSMIKLSNLIYFNASFNSLNTSLKRWVKVSLPDTMAEVIVANLLEQESEHYSAKLESVSSIMVLPLECSVESPDQRIDMNDAPEKLKKIRVKLVSNLETAES
ncbi:hypothetical protein RJ640_002689 [Escallonia rubra]|uniref:Uncharacterized protein n=1 Tax=Escallonia rubra TaxID=112253 RepID=A0AA88RRP3_9ASTE|nr:hypothetical protein RJ640_002689 [Escallonia rubra]